MKNSDQAYPHGITGKYDTQVNHEENSFIINGGKSSGRNLFHIFDMFNIHSGEHAVFNDAGFSNTIARVSGNSYSWINGTLSSNADHLFFINPNGILFGPNAVFNAASSFSCSAGDYLSFEDETVFYGNDTDILSSEQPESFGFIDRAPLITDSDVKARIQLIQSKIQFLNNLTLHAKQIDIDDAIISLTPWDKDNSHKISILTDTLKLTKGTQIISFGSSDERGNQIEILSNHISLDGMDSVLGQGCTIYTRAESYDIFTNQWKEGHSGNISISTQTLHLNDGAQVSASAEKLGNSGSVSIVADLILMQGNSLSGNASLIASNVCTGKSGTVTIHTNTLELTDGAQILSSTFGESPGGDVTIYAKEQIRIHGQDDVQGSSVLAISEHQGNAGNIHISTGDLLMNNQGAIATYSQSGEALKQYGHSGNIEITAHGNIILKEKAAISAEALQSGGGRINIVSDAQVSFFNSGMNTSVALGEHDGGSIYIQADMFFMNHGKLFARADKGNGGNISIYTDSYICSTDSLIDASSTAGLQGHIYIDSPDNILNKAITSLPDNFLKAEQWEQKACHKRKGENVSHLYYTKLFGYFSFDEPDLTKDINVLYDRCFLPNVPLQDSDTRSQAWACYQLGKQYQYPKNNDQAADIIKKAAFLADASGDLSIRIACYQALARQYLKNKELSKANENYEKTIHLLTPLCKAFYSNQKISLQTFQTRIRPLYEEYLQFLFDCLTLEKNIINDQVFQQKIINTLETLKYVEMNDFYQDDCIRRNNRRSFHKVSENVAVLYYVVLPEAFYIVVSTSDAMPFICQKISRNQLTDFVRKLRSRLNPGSNRYKYYARKLYQWLIAPVELYLKESVDTLLIVPDRILSLLPFSVLLKNEKFLIENYALGILPSLTMTSVEADSAPVDHEILFGGLSQKSGIKGNLPAIISEIKYLERLPCQILLNDTFTYTHLLDAFQNKPYSIIHIATHGFFNKDGTTELLTGDDSSISLDDIFKLLQVNRFRKKPIELLILNTCHSAIGDERVAQGLAGVAVRSGVKSALASLWYIEDESAPQLINHFYDMLYARQTKIKALQSAQRQMMTDHKYKHPAFWAPYLLVGNGL
ncbi:MAG: CHAT domain-containing protein [Candidatus Magnetomorum sp.]|nr:CHAT domain-containing protein [Candidatus Magnetomorum sp.]